MTRVIAGVAGGRRLAVPPGRSTRPTSDRTREGLFATVGSILGPLDGARVLDLYAGSGAVGLEAASRGAGHVLLVESDPRAVRVIRRNAASLGIPGVEVLAERVERLARAHPPGAPYDLVFADPPYDLPGEAVTAVLRDLAAHGWLRGGALVAVERASRDAPLTWPEGYAQERSRRYGDATLWYGRVVCEAGSKGGHPSLR